MGTRSKRHIKGAFGQSLYEKIRNYNERVKHIQAVQAILEVDKSIDQDMRTKLERRLKELTR